MALNRTPRKNKCAKGGFDNYNAQHTMLSFLKIGGAVLSCLFGILAIRAKTREDQEVNWPASTRFNVAALIVSLIITASLQIAESQQEHPATQTATPQELEAVVRRSTEPLGNFEVSAVIAYSLNADRWLAPLKKSLSTFAGSQPEPEDTNEENGYGTIFSISPQRVKANKPMWWLLTHHEIFIDLYESGTSDQAINVTIPGYYPSEQADPTRPGDIELTVMGFDPKRPKNYKFAYDAKNEILLITSTFTAANVVEERSNSKLTSISDLRSARIAVRISDPELVGPITLQLEKAGIFDDDDDEALFGGEQDHIVRILHGAQLRALWITTAKHTIEFRESDFKKESKATSGIRYIGTLPANESLFAKQLWVSPYEPTDHK